MEYKTIITASAEKDLDAIFYYIANVFKNIFVAQRFVDKLIKEINGLSFMPRANPRMHKEPFRRKGYRVLIYKGYMMPFFIDEKEKIVSVIRVFHGKTHYGEDYDG